MTTEPGEPTHEDLRAAGTGLRVGDAERNQATERLRENLVAGRLDQDEFDDRVQRALTARTQDRLDALFTDLPAGQAMATPGPSPTVPEPAAAHPSSGTAGRVLAVLAALAWPVALIFNFATDWDHWWVILIPIFLVPALHRGLGGWSTDRHAYREERRRRRHGD